MSRCLHALLRLAQTRGFAGAGLALLLLLALLVPQKQAPDKPDGELTLGPPPNAVVAPAAPPARAAAPPPAAAPRRVSAVRRPPAPRAPAPAPKRQQQKKKAVRPSLAAYGVMQRSYQPEAPGGGLCPGDSASLGLTCRSVEVHGATSGYLLRFQVCPTTAARFELRFPTEAEVDMRVLDAATGQRVWTWQPPRPFLDEAHVLTSEVGSCWVWQTPWGKVDDRGRPLPDALYELQVDFLEVEDQESYSHRFSA